MSSKCFVLEDSDICDFSKTQEVVDVAEVLAPHIPDAILSIGLDYRAHADEGGLKLPKYPVNFHKSKNSITGPHDFDPQAGNIDYENELDIITSKDVKNVSTDNTPNCILGYTIGNDISSRAWQMPETSGGQYCYAKNFDSFCPIGPVLWSPEKVGDPQNLGIVTRRNGKVVQKSNTSDMISAGSLVMRGTAPGVAMFASNPPNSLKYGEVVESEIEKLRSLKNTFFDG